MPAYTLSVMIMVYLEYRFAPKLFGRGDFVSLTIIWLIVGYWVWLCARIYRRARKLYASVDDELEILPGVPPSLRKHSPSLFQKEG